MKVGPSHRAVGWLVAGAIAAVGCHGAESFSVGNLFVSQGGGGAGGGVTGVGGAPELDAGETDDASTEDADVAPLPDAGPDLPREVHLPEGPFTPINCGPIPPYMPDDQSYGPGTTIFSLRDLRVYRCMQGLQSGWCTIGAYEPSLDIGYWRDCWIPIGYCR